MRRDNLLGRQRRELETNKPTKMSKQFTDSDKAKMQALFEQFKNRASKLLEDKDKIQTTLKRAFDKAMQNEGPIAEVFHDLKLLLSLVKDYMSGAYREIPYGSIVAAVAAILYFVSPIDFIPDFIPVVGLVDDVFVIGFVLKKIHSDLEKYEKWKSLRL